MRIIQSFVTYHFLLQLPNATLYPYQSGLLYRHCGNYMITPLPMTQFWWIKVDVSREKCNNTYPKQSRSHNKTKEKQNPKRVHSCGWILPTTDMLCLLRHQLPAYFKIPIVSGGRVISVLCGKHVTSTLKTSFVVVNVGTIYPPSEIRRLRPRFLFNYLLQAPHTLLDIYEKQNPWWWWRGFFLLMSCLYSCFVHHPSFAAYFVLLY